MDTPGIEVRGLRQITGESGFNEVFLTDVRVPKASVLGAPGLGGRIAMTTLMNERSAPAGRPAAMGEGPIAEAIATYERAVHGGAGAAGAPERRWRLCGGGGAERG